MDKTTLCYTDPGDVRTDKHVSVICERRLLAKYVSVQLEGSENKLEICEIEIPTGRLLSEEKPSYGSAVEKNKYVRYGNDGQTGTFYASEALDTPYWYVDLQNVYNLNTITITTREDCKFKTN